MVTIPAPRANTTTGALATRLRGNPAYQAFWPRLGGYVVAAWLGGIIINLLLIPGYYDIALRDFGLLLAALTLARLATAFPSRRI
jgi:hypothetical protein